MSENSPRQWLELSEEGPRRVVAIASVAALLIATTLLHSEIGRFVSVHPLWLSFVASLPGFGLLLMAYLGWRDAGETNRLRIEANRHLKDANGLRAEANELQQEITRLQTELNKHLQQIADNTKRAITPAERNAGILRKYLRKNASVSERQGVLGNAPEIVEISDDHVVTLFSPSSPSSSVAWCVGVHCDDLQVVEIPHGSCPVRLTVLKRYGPNVQLGEITRWEDRLTPTATVFPKGDTVYYARFVKPGSPEIRTLAVYADKVGANSFLLEGSAGDRAVGDKKEISKKALALLVDYKDTGFTHSTSNGPNGRLFIW